jgi:hypothetical protein
MKPDIETHTSEPPNIEEQEKPINKVTHMEEKSMKDPVLGALIEDRGRWGKQTLDFGGRTLTIDLLIHNGDENKITESASAA